MSTPARRTPRAERGWSREASPFHAGEQAVQRMVGVREQVERAGRNMIREDMPDQHRQLFAALPLLIVGSLDAAGRVWASIFSGAPGFVSSPTSKTLEISAQPLFGDPLGEQLVVGAPLGVLGIQLETRRRNRANGHVVARDAQTFTVGVEQSFGNCNKYIQARAPTFDAGHVGLAGAPSVEGSHLSARARALLDSTDTFFIATASASAASGSAGEGVDVSHRGGRPGFVRVTETSNGSVLTVPDFSGNFIFNTFGNLQVNPHAGIVCANFATGDVLSISGTAQAIWEGSELESYEGAERLLQFQVETGVFLERALPLRFQGLKPSPALANTGIWSESQPSTVRPTTR